MTSSFRRTCPRDACPSEIVVASREDIEVGAPLWRCGAGHHGPMLVGSPAGIDRSV